MKKKYESQSGVYKLKNLITGKFYIGSSRSLAKRRGSHRYSLKNGIKNNLRMTEDYNKHGLDSFEFEVIEYCEVDKLLEREQYYFELLKPTYNIWNNVYNALERSYTEEQLLAFKNLKHPIKDKKAFSYSLKEAWRIRKLTMSHEDFKKAYKGKPGMKHSDEAKKLMSIKGKGRSKPDSFKEKIRQLRLGTKLINGKFVKIEVF